MKSEIKSTGWIIANLEGEKPVYAGFEDYYGSWPLKYFQSDTPVLAQFFENKDYAQEDLLEAVNDITGEPVTGSTHGWRVVEVEIRVVTE